MRKRKEWDNKRNKEVNKRKRKIGYTAQRQISTS
jgi:hypothetical protein